MTSLESVAGSPEPSPEPPLIDLIEDAVIVAGRDCIVLKWNHGATKIFGWSRAEATGCQLSGGIEGASDSLAAAAQRVLESGKRWAGELAFTRRDGTAGLCDAVIRPMERRRVLITVRDITRKWRFEEQMAEEHKRLRRLIDGLPESFYLKDGLGRYVMRNRAHEVITGIPDEQFYGKTIVEMPEDPERTKHYEEDMRILRDGESVTGRLDRVAYANGKVGWFLTSKFPIRDDSGAIVGIVGSARDVTETVVAQKQVEDERRLLRTVIDGIPDVVIFKDREGRYVMRNEAHRAMTGLPDEAVIGRAVLDLPIPVELASAYHNDDMLVIMTGDPVINREEPFQQSDGRSGWFLTSKYPIRDASGAISGLVMIARDITERRRAVEERQEIERKLLETQKLESLGVLAGGIAHDFNNLLTGIIGNASLAAMDIGEHPEARQSLDQIERAAVRAADLCKQMLAYSGKGRFVVANQDINGVIQETTELLRLSISKRAELQFALGTELPPVLADATQLRQVIMNLVINASEAIGEKDGTIGVATGCMDADAEFLAGCHVSPETVPGRFVWFEVSDNGCGMPAEVRARIFDPFFTTKFTGRGLGLAAVLGIVRGHKGAMHVSSEPGAGTTFRILLPAVTGDADGSAAPAPADSAWHAEGVVLVVDDDDTVRTITARMLQSFGFTVLTACDGREGVDKFAAASDVRAVLLDLTMPKLDGEQAFQEMRAIKPGVRVLLMSGFSEQESIKRFAGKGLAGFLQKPFNVAALRDKLREMLASP